jgi:autoinducer 2 (AI-2) kinase
MAIDAGTGSVRAVIFDESGGQLACSQHEWEHLEDKRWPGSMCFDWEHNWLLAKNCVRSAIKEARIDPRDIVAVSTTCMREGIVLYDAEGKEIWACANVDSRSNDEVLELISTDSNMEREIYAVSGQTFALGALPRLLWVKNKQPEIYERVKTMSMFNDWLIYRLAGVIATEPSNGSTTGVFDLKKRVWDPSIAKKCGLRTDIFPTVSECGEKIGTVSAAAAAETGLAEGTPVVIGGGDAQLGCVGVGVVKAGQAAVFGGSFWQYEFNTASGQTDKESRVRVNCHAVPGVWQYEALAFKPGIVMRWYRDAFCELEKKQAELSGKDPYYLMDIEADRIPAGCYGMMCAFSDVMNFISWRHAAPTFSNFDFDPAKYNRYTFYRAIMENTALVTRGHMDLVEEATGSRPTEIVFAGGAAKSPVWSKILADVLGMPVKVPSVKEATALGAAILAGRGAGLWHDTAQASGKLVKWDATYTPDAKNHETYNEIYRVWRKFYAAELAQSDAGTTRYMWAAPGAAAPHANACPHKNLEG